MYFPYQLLRKRLEKVDINMLMKLKVFMFDCDGVLWRGSQAISGAIDTLNYLKDNGKMIYYCTNSSARSRLDTLEILDGFGVKSTVNEIITSSYATAQYLKNCSKGGEVYVIGEKGIYDELGAVGIQCHGMEDNDKKDISILSSMNPNVTSVVVGLDKNINYIKLSRAAAYIRDQKCSFVATNNDASDPNEEGLIVGAAGCMVSAVSAICGKQPDIILGKPNRAFVDIILQQHPELDTWDIMMVGDRLETDIALAHQNGLKSLAVLTGIAKEEDVLGCSETVAPMYYTDSVSDLRDIFVFSEDLTNEDEEKHAIAELERLKQERKELKMKEREERNRIKQERQKVIEEGLRIVEEEMINLDEEKRKALEAKSVVKEEFVEIMEEKLNVKHN